MNTASSFSQIPHTLLYNGIQSRMFNVFGYSPQVGQGGTTVTIDTLFNNSWHHDVCIRIVIGHKPIHTVIKSVGGNIPNLWRCTGFVPEFEVHKNSSIQTVDVTIQAVDNRNAILDTITIGRFTYQEHDPSWLEPGVFDVPHRGSTHLSATQHHTAHYVPLHHGLGSRTSPAPLQCQTSPQTPPKPKRRLRRLQESDAGIDFDPVSLILATKPSLADLGNLTKEEERAGRRLVAFDRKVVGDSVHLSFRRISPEEYTERLFVISCIYHKATVEVKTPDQRVQKVTRERWFTSVEILKLVEFIADGKSSSDDKSRNRRNLEFIKPTTVTRAGLPQFFQLLMDFPLPKPRGIEKDIKVFPWDSLEAGLMKVMEKYAWVSDLEPSSSPSTTDPSPVLPSSEPPRLPTNKFHEALQHPAPQYHFSIPVPASLSNGAHNTPHNNNMGQPQPNYVPNMPNIDPRWLQHQHHSDRIGLAVASPYADRAIPSPSPGPAEFPNDDHSFALPDLEFIASPGHIVCGVDPMVPIM
ncbi:hypothetical protein F5888DRAFT_104315 [Russula emetica]|nr:hypothetical protein F5888DRAFT_104315 [Russula emetica]